MGPAVVAVVLDAAAVAGQVAVGAAAAVAAPAHHGQVGGRAAAPGGPRALRST